MKMKHFKNFYRKKENVVIYDSYRFGNFVGKQISIIEINNITECLPKSKNIEVIDIGAGTGRLSINLVNKGYNVTAVDSSKEMLSHIQLTKRLTKFTGDLFNLKKRFKNKSFDAAVSLRVFFHLTKDEKQKAISKIKNLCKPKSIIVFDTLNRLSLDYILPNLFSKHKELNFFESKKEMESLINSLDLSIIGLKREFIIPRGIYLHSPKPLFLILRMVDKILLATPLKLFATSFTWSITNIK